MERSTSASERGVKFWIASWLTCDTEMDERKRDLSPAAAVTTMSSPATGARSSAAAGAACAAGAASCANDGMAMPAMTSAIVDIQLC